MKEKNISIELLRIIACFSVILLHLGAKYFRDIPIDSDCWKISNVYHGFTRFTVPCFIMISGYINLDKGRKWTLKKILVKVVYYLALFVGWQLFYALFRIYLEGDITLSIYLLERIFTYWTNPYFHLWYILELIELLIITPFLWILVNSKEGKKIEELAIILFFFLKIIPTTVLAFYIEECYYVTKVSEWIRPEIVTDYAGYYLMGHYLFFYEIPKKIEKILYIIGVVGIISGVALGQFYSIIYDSPIEDFYDFFTISAFFLSIAVVLFFKNYVSKVNWNQKARKGIYKIAETTLGIYLLHIFLMGIFFKAGYDILDNTFIAIFLMGIVIFVCGSLITVFFKKIYCLKKRLLDP